MVIMVKKDIEIISYQHGLNDSLDEVEVSPNEIVMFL